MISKKTPSYLLQSLSGIYYFRVRIPKLIQVKHQTKKREIKKSLHTSDPTLAVKRARRLFLIMEETEYTMKDLDTLEYENNYSKKLLIGFLIASFQDENKDDFLSTTDEESSSFLFMSNLSFSEQELLKKELDRWNRLPNLRREKIIEQLKLEEGIYCNKENNVPNDYTKVNHNKISVSSVIDLYMNHLIEDKKWIGKPLPKQSIDEFRSIYREFLDIVGKDLMSCELNKEVIKHYEKTIRKLPANYQKNKRYKVKDIKDILKMSISIEDRRSPITFNKYIIRVNQLLRWAGKEDYIEKGLGEYLSRVPDNVKSNEKREEFTGEELTLLFNNDIYERHKYKQKEPSRYWLPLLALLTGARGEELAQIFADDVIQDKETGIFYINFKEDRNRKQRLKNINAQRRVPIHKKLISLGFLEFVDTRKPDLILFPELDVLDSGDDGDKRFKKFGNNFNRKTNSGWKWKLGVTRDKTSFHSFRHNVVNFFSNSNIPKKVVCFIVGHEYDGEGLNPNYIKASEMKEMKDAIDKLNYPTIDWRKIKKKNWK